MHADLKMPRFMPTDFQLGTLVGALPGASFADWPVDYDALEPFYAYGEKVLGVQGKAGSSPVEGPALERLSDAARPRDVLVAKIVSAGLTQARLHAVSLSDGGQLAAVRRAPGVRRLRLLLRLRLSVEREGIAAGDDAAGARSCRATALLLPGTRATRLLMNGAGNAVVGVEAIDPDGARRTFTADRYVLAASPIEDARLLLLSDPGGAGVGNSSGLVGRNLTFHLPDGRARASSKSACTAIAAAPSTHGFADFRGVPDDPDRPLGGIVEISAGEGADRRGAVLLADLRRPRLRRRAASSG